MSKNFSTDSIFDYYPFLLKQLISWGVLLEDAEEIAADILLDLFLKLKNGDFQYEGQVINWLKIFARNRATKVARQKKYNISLDEPVLGGDDDEDIPEGNKELGEYYDDFFAETAVRGANVPSIKIFIEFMKNEKIFSKLCLKIYALTFPFLRLESKIPADELEEVLNLVLTDEKDEETSLEFSDNQVPKKQRDDEEVLKELNRWLLLNKVSDKSIDKTNLRTTRSRCKDSLENAFRSSGYNWYYFETERKNKKK